MDADRFLALMGRDKKVLDGQLRLVLLEAIGSAIVTSEISEEQLRAVLD